MHSCAHALSTVADLHHGLANGIMIDHVMRFNADSASDKMAELARVHGLPELSMGMSIIPVLMAQGTMQMSHIVQNQADNGWTLLPLWGHGLSLQSWLLLIPWVCSLFEMFLNRKKKFSPNEIAEFHFGEGSELRQPLGVAIVGGLVASQLLTLLTTPVVYLLLDRLPNLRMDPDGDDPHIRGQVFRSPTSLPVLFDRARAAGVTDSCSCRPPRATTAAAGEIALGACDLAIAGGVEQVGVREECGDEAIVVDPGDEAERILAAWLAANAKPLDESLLPSIGPVRAVIEINGGQYMP